MNVESEMAGADGLGVERLDPCAQIAESVGYHAEGEGSMEVLIAYKDALEGAVRRVASLPDPKHVDVPEEAKENAVTRMLDRRNVGWQEEDPEHPTPVRIVARAELEAALPELIPIIASKIVEEKDREIEWLRSKGEENGRLAIEVEADRDSWRNRARQAVEEERERMLCEVAVEAAKDALRIPPGQYMTNARVRSAFNAALAAVDRG